MWGVVKWCYLHQFLKNILFIFVPAIEANEAVMDIKNIPSNSIGSIGNRFLC